MNVLVVEPGYLPYEKEIKDGADHLEQMQAIVGGLIEPIYECKVLCLIVEETDCRSSSDWFLVQSRR